VSAAAPAPLLEIDRVSVRFGAVQGIPLGFAATDTPLDKIDTGAKPGPSPSGTATWWPTRLPLLSMISRLPEPMPVM